MEYYRKKIAEYDEEHEGLVSKLEEYKVTYEEQVSQCINCYRYHACCLFFIVPDARFADLYTKDLKSGPTLKILLSAYVKSPVG